VIPPNLLMKIKVVYIASFPEVFCVIIGWNWIYPTGLFFVHMQMKSIKSDWPKNTRLNSVSSLFCN